jgi:hypothetical protein
MTGNAFRRKFVEAGMTRLAHILAAICLIMTPAMLRADARGDAESARRRLDSTESRLQQICFDLASARAALNDAYAQQSSNASGAAAAQQQAAASAAALDDARRRIDAAAASARNLADAVTQRRAEFETIKATADDLQKQVEQYRAQAIATFESSPAFTARADELTAAEKERTAEEAATLDWLRETDAYSDSFEAVEEAEAIVRAERSRQPEDPQSLAAASQAWMDALNQLERLKAEALSKDQSVAAANAKVAAAKKSREQLVARFNNDLSKDSELNRLIAALTTQQNSATAAAAEINTLESQRAAAEAEVASLQSVIDAEGPRLEQARRDADAFAASADSAAWNVSRLQSDVQRLCDLELWVRRERDDAARDLRRIVEYANAERAREEIARRERGGRGGFVQGGRDDDRDGRLNFVGRRNQQDDRTQSDRERRERAEQDERERAGRDREADVTKDKAERQRVVAEATARRAEEERLSKLSDEQADRQRQADRDEEIRRAEEKQRGERREQQEQARLASERQQAEERGRAAEQAQVADRREQQERVKAEQDTARAERERHAANEHREAQQREAQAREQHDRQESEKAAHDNAESQRREQAQREQAQRDAHAESQRREQEQRNAQAHAEEQKRDSDRRENEQRQAQAKADQDRRESEQRRQDDDARQHHQAEQHDHDRDSGFRKK